MNKLSDMVRPMFQDGFGDRLFSRLQGISGEGRRWNGRVFALLLVVLAAHFMLYVYSAVRLFPFPYSFKGWCGDGIMYAAYLLSRGRNFYVDPAQAASAMGGYNPGFEFMAAPLIRIFGLHMWVGRLVSGSGLVAVWVLIHRAVKKITGRAFYGLIAVGLLMAAYGLMNAHFDDIHPDSWAVACGLLSLAWAESALDKPLFIIPAALAAFLSFFFNQPGISFGLGAAFFLFLARPRHAALFILVLAVLVAASLVIGQSLTGGTYWEYTVQTMFRHSIISINVPGSVYLLISACKFAIVFLVFILLNKPGLLPLTMPYAAALPVVFCFNVFSTAQGGPTMGNFFPTATLAAVLLAGGLHYVRERMAGDSPRMAFLLLSLLLAQGLIFVQWRPANINQEHYRLAQRLEHIIRGTPGEVLVFDRISFAYLNGKTVYDNLVDVSEFNWGYTGRLASQLQNRYFERIIAPQQAMISGMWGRKKLIDPLVGNYETEEVITKPEWLNMTPLVILQRKSGAPGAQGRAPASLGPEVAPRPPGANNGPAN